jgi:hypothetical protein
VRNVSSVWLGMTMGCAECHDHKFDPFTTREFYRLGAFFADIQEKGVGKQTITTFPTPAQQSQLDQLEKRIAALNEAMRAKEPELERSRPQWEATIKEKGAKDLPDTVADALAIEPKCRLKTEEETIREYHRKVAPELEALRRSLAAVEKERDALVGEIPATFVTVSGTPRVVRVLPRGNWADDSGEIVTPGLPACLGSGPKTHGRPTRLDLAEWLVSGHNPLVARVFMNRLWKIAFGKGLVDPSDDFGIRGTAPSHPDLLDWLAVEFVEQGWDVKAMFKLILMSNTYRQSSRIDPESVERDPTNQWLARQNRFRIEAEFIRDNALAISGLLSLDVGGRSVKPYQPDGYWASRFTQKEYQPDTGEKQHRRGLYTYWCRNYLHPAMLLFDAPSRQSCTADRGRSSTPLQALALLNDPSQAEAAQALARRILLEGGSDDLSRLRFAFRVTQARNPNANEEAILHGLLNKQRSIYFLDEEAAMEAVGMGAAPFPEFVDWAEMAAWISVARVVLNLYGTITRS